MRKLITIFWVLGAVILQATERPNVILMMVDDLGYNDLSCYGSERMRTPHLDKMADEGARLTSFYAGSSVCTPSRMALLTGAYPKRLGWQGGVMGHKIKWEKGLAPEALTIAEIFKGAGYTTGLSGKWHLGNNAGMLPMDQGFESVFYIKSSNNQTKKLWREEKLVADPFDNRLLSEKFTGEAIRFIRANKENPFFLYLPFTAPHFPAQAHPDWKGKSSNAAYGDVVEELDHRVGEILAALKKEKLDQKTIFVFLSDNGPEGGQRKWASAKPYRGGKWSSLEGGMRVPCLVRWPGVIPAKQELHQMISAMDLMPTLAHACGLDSKEIPQIDGLNVWETLRGKKDAVHPRTNLLYWNGWAKLEAIRVEDWKLYLTEVEKIPDSKKGPVLINLKNDLEEKNNMAAQYPDRVAAMRKLAETLAADVEKNALPLGGPDDDGKHLFILSGQSNMSGMDPEVSFTPAVTKAFGKENIIVAKSAYSGASIRSWVKSNHEIPPPTRGRVPKERGHFYETLITKVKAATKGESLKTVTFVWMQGESDLNNTAYNAYLKELLEQVQRDLAFQKVNIVIGRISDSGLDQPKGLEGRLNIRKVQQDFAESHPRGAWVDTDDLNDREVEGKLIHDLHYTEEGYRILGKRFAEKSISLIREAE